MLKTDYLSRFSAKTYNEAKANMVIYSLKREREEVKNVLDRG